ncbi:patatin-like phospholipase family protein [Clostridium sp.]|uniref:patatin-like phospholipase family protein n=1 Tax=Clostridium sp. TaxID=1506 RepID=UPI0032177292
MNSYGLVLGGGGSKGAYEVGVWKALIELNIDISVVVGTSIGAINSAFICSNNYKNLEELWLSIDFSTCFYVDDNFSADEKLSSKNIPKLIKNVISNRGLDSTPLKRLLQSYLNEDIIRNSSIDFGIVTLSMFPLKPIEIFKTDIPYGKIIDYIMASCSLPGLKHMVIDGVTFFDGGMYNNIPTSMLLDSSCSTIIQVDIDGPGFKQKFNNKNNIPIIEIKCSESLGPIINFDGPRIKRNIKLGYLDTLKAFNHLMGQNYYFFKDEVSKGLLKDIDDTELNIIMNSVNFNNSIYDHLKLLRAIKRIKNFSGIISRNHIDIIMAMEITAEVIEIERCAIYSYDELLNKILEKVILLRQYIDNKEISLKDHFIFSNCDILNISKSTIAFRNTLALTFPKKFIAHMFLCLINYRINS